MNTEWNLTTLYQGLDDPRYETDFSAVADIFESAREQIAAAPALCETERAELLLKCLEQMNEAVSPLAAYLSLRLAVETDNSELMGQMNRLMMLTTQYAADETAAIRMLGEITDLDSVCRASSTVSAYRFFMQEQMENRKHLLGDEAESVIAAMDMTGGGAWGDLQSFLTSTVSVDFRGESLPLSEVRNLAFDADPKVRKDAYEAELACYEKIRDPAAFALNNIKNQVSMLSLRRGYQSPLAMTLEQARMKRETLDAMMEAVREYLPVFHKYLRHKAKKLGYQNGLPWYELFAPLGRTDRIYSLEECRGTLTEVFESFSPELAGLIRRAFDQAWIDFYPRNGKQGGAFCADVPSLKESRILTNYDGTFSSVDTLAHELGHAFHNSLLFSERVLNRGTPMPVAETASTFNEVFLCAHMLRQAKTDEERLAFLDMDLREKCQTIVDIYSRYLFESAVFEKAQCSFLMADDLCAMMLDAQKQAYGDGLDENVLHPYMWINKSHYYSTGLSFYNFPYTFGTLFAGGLYARYLQEGAGFVEQYKTMLRTTGIHSIEESGAVLGIDLTRKEFWQTSLAQIAEEINLFCSL